MKPEQRRQRINAMADSLCRGIRHEAADRHIESYAAVNSIGIPCRPDPRSDYLSGWDDAMETRFEELVEENHELHGIVMQLCQRLCVERCPVCKGQGVDDDVKLCPHCDGGWRDKP